MDKKLPYIIGGGVLLLLVGVLVGNHQKSSQTQMIQNIPSYRAPSPSSSANPVSSNAPEDVVPGLYKNQIQNTAVKQGFTISTVTVENNTDETGKAVGDHLELTLKNTSGQDLTNFEVYYTITDQTSNKKEGYYKKLAGFVLKNGATQQINFDNKQGAGHFSANKNSIYFTSSNKLLFDVMVSTPGYKVQNAQAVKAAGGAETKD